MSVTHLTLPKHIDNSLTQFTNQILDCPGRFIDSSKPTMNTMEVDDIQSSSFPGLSDTFIKNWDLSSLEYKGNNLYKGYLYNVDNISFVPMSTFMGIREWLLELYKGTNVIPRGNFLYRPNSCMGWHTNSDTPGTRIYFVYTVHSYNSYFKWVDRTNNTIITDLDKPGWNVREFKVGSEPNDYLWHCIGTGNYPRISFGCLVK